MTNFGWKVEATQRGKGAWIQAQFTEAISLVDSIFPDLIGTHRLSKCSNFPAYLQGWTKRLFVPDCVKFGEKVAFCLPTTGRETQFFHPISHNLGRLF